MKKSLQKLTAILTVLFAMLSFTGCGKQSAALRGNNSQEKQIITIGVMPDTDSIPLIIAEQRGYFKDEGVNVKLEHFKSARNRDSALQSGKLDGVITDILALIFAREGGFDLKITSSSVGDYKMVVGKNSGITSADKLKGKSVALSLNTLIEYSTDKILQASNLKIEDVKKMSIPEIPVRLEMLQNGKVDAATLPEPLATVAIKNGASLINSTSKLGINPGIIAFSQKSIDTKGNEIAAVYRAYNRAIEYIQNNKPSDYMDVVIKAAGFPEGVKDDLVLPEYKKAEMPSEKEIKDVIEWMKDKKLIKNDYKISELIYDKFINSDGK